MFKPGSPTAVTIGRWGGRLPHHRRGPRRARYSNFPYLLPNRLPGLVLYELGPGLVLAIGAAVIITRESGPRFRAATLLALFALAALAWEFAEILRGQWI